MKRKLETFPGFLPFELRWLCEPRDLWIGVYWVSNYYSLFKHWEVSIYICLIPCFPILIRFWLLPVADPKPKPPS